MKTNKQLLEEYSKNHKGMELGDEVFTYFYFQWNITRILDYIKNNNREPVNFLVTDLKRNTGIISIDEEYALSKHDSTPIIITDIYEHVENMSDILILDGYHRLCAANHRGETNIKCYVLSFDEQVLFLRDKNMAKFLVENYRNIR